MPVYARGTIARLNQSLTLGTGADPGDRPVGYYRVRQEQQWRAARWRPGIARWEAGGGLAWPARHWDEIGDRVA